MIISDAYISQINSPVRTIKARVELFEGSTLVSQFSYEDALKSFSIDRVGEGKFFGFGICQRLNTHLIDMSREIDVSTAHNLKISFGADSEYIYPLPNFYVSEVHRDEITNELSITAYDALYKATEHFVSELELESYTIREFAQACATLLGVPMKIIMNDDGVFNTEYAAGANFESTENIREALNDVAEATQTIYYLDSDGNLVFKRLDKDGEPVATIDKEKYFELKCGENRRLATVCHTTELGDSVSASTTAIGSTQFVRDNAFWELREDIADIVDNALAAVGGFTIHQFDCSWRGNFLIEIGDKIALITKDNQTVHSYLLNDTIEYNGALSQKTEWKYDENEGETASNPTSLGDVLKQTYAKVDKANKEIEIVASEATANSEAISQLSINTGEIETSVGRIETTYDNAIDALNKELVEVQNKVNATISAEDVEILISQKLTGVESVETSTGFTFNENGLTISKSESNISTVITENGMTIKKGSSEMLTANNQGVKAKDLHATTYLIIGDNSRFEDVGSTRTACYWIGG